MHAGASLGPRTQGTGRVAAPGNDDQPLSEKTLRFEHATQKVVQEHLL